MVKNSLLFYSPISYLDIWTGHHAPNHSLRIIQTHTLDLQAPILLTLQHIPTSIAQALRLYQQAIALYSTTFVIELLGFHTHRPLALDHTRSIAIPTSCFTICFYLLFGDAS